MIAHLEVREHRENLHRSNSGFTVVLCDLKTSHRLIYWSVFIDDIE